LAEWRMSFAGDSLLLNETVRMPRGCVVCSRLAGAASRRGVAGRSILCDAFPAARRVCDRHVALPTAVLASLSGCGKKASELGKTVAFAAVGVRRPAMRQASRMAEYSEAPKTPMMS
jgi:hypothetical protein